MTGRGERVRVAERVQELIDIGRGALDGADTPTARGARLSMLAPAAVQRTPDAHRHADTDGTAEQLASATVPGAGATHPHGRHASGAGGGVRASLSRLVTRCTGVRVVPSSRAAAAMGLVALTAAVATLCWVLVNRPHQAAVAGAGPVVATQAAAPAPAPASSAAAPSGTTRPAAASASPSAEVVTVDVAGRVRHPGVYELPAGARVNDAVEAAGGPLPGVDLSGVNLAAPVHDGQQIAIGVPGAGPSAAGASGSAGTGAGARPSGTPGKVDLNTATAGQLQALPGVGPVLAQHILDWRAAHGRFATVGQLREVSGIGPVKYAGLKGLVTV